MEFSASEKTFKSKGKNYYNDLLNFKNCEDLNGLITCIKDFVQEKTKAITTNQLRNIYDDILKIETWKDLQMYRPRLAYIAARKRDVQPFVEFIDGLINDIRNPEKEGVQKIEAQIDSFKNFLESIVAFHKFYNNN